MAETGCLRDGKFQNFESGNVEITNDCTSSGSIRNPTGNVSRTSFTYSALTGGETLTVNTNYSVAAGAATVTLPATGVPGDNITFLWIVDNAGNNILINSSAAAAPYWATTSYVFVGKLGNGTGANTQYSIVSAPDGTNNRVFTITNTGANQCSGVGSSLTATYDGTHWCLDGYILCGGAATAVPSAAFGN